MTVKELKELLEHYPEDLQVVYPDYSPVKYIVESTAFGGTLILSDETDEQIIGEVPQSN